MGREQQGKPGSAIQERGETAGGKRVVRMEELPNPTALMGEPRPTKRSGNCRGGV